MEIEQKDNLNWGKKQEKKRLLRENRVVLLTIDH